MDIRCMSDDTVMDAQECLDCASSGRARCGYDYGILRFIFAQYSERPNIHVTDLTGCLRRAFFSKTQPIAEYPHERLVLALGSVTHGLLEGHDENVKTELPLSAFGVVGTADAVMVVQDGIVEKARIIDYKTTRWLSPSKLPYGSHDLQVNIYAAMLREMGYDVASAAIQYIDMSGPTKCRKCKVAVAPNGNGGLSCPTCGYSPGDAHLGAVVFEVSLDDHDAIVALIVERRDALRLALDMGDAPEAETSFLCNYCAYINQCEEGTAWIQHNRR